jgi:hypothetical protein
VTAALTASAGGLESLENFSSTWPPVQVIGFVVVLVRYSLEFEQSGKP